MRRRRWGQTLSLGVPALRSLLLLLLVLSWVAGTGSVFVGADSCGLQPAVAAASLRATPGSRMSSAVRQQLGLVYRLARYSTYFDLRLTDRVHNIRLAAQWIDGILLQPGQEFSFNAIVGERTARRGFRSAPVLVGGELVDGLGGGICQVSTTLYNVVLLADLPVRERVHHSRPLGYVPPGRDATVFDGLYDLRFVNDRPDPILLTAEVVENRLTVAAWGSSPPTRQLDIVALDEQLVPAPVEWVENPQLQAGAWRLVQLGWDGLAVKVHRRLSATSGANGSGGERPQHPSGVDRSERGLVQSTPSQKQPGRQEWVSTDLYPPRSYRIEVGPGSDRGKIWSLVQGAAHAPTGPFQPLTPPASGSLGTLAIPPDREAASSPSRSWRFSPFP